VIAGVRDGLCDSRGVVGIGTGVRFGGLGVTDGSDRDSSAKVDDSVNEPKFFIHAIW
jgi:hypothetical protein